MSDKGKILQVEEDDLLRINLALGVATRFHIFRDQMNAELHLAEVRWSPLTALLIAEEKRLAKLLGLLEGENNV